MFKTKKSKYYGEWLLDKNLIPSDEEGYRYLEFDHSGKGQEREFRYDTSKKVLQAASPTTPSKVMCPDVSFPQEDPRSGLCVHYGVLFRQNGKGGWEEHDPRQATCSVQNSDYIVVRTPQGARLYSY